MREMKDSNVEWIGMIPAEWKIVKLKNICTRIIVGLATSVTQYYQQDGVPMFRNLNIKENRLDTEDVLFLNPEWADKQEGKKIHTNDILTVHTGYIGISCLVPEEYNDSLTFTTLISTVDSRYALPKYINYWINISRLYSRIYKSVDTGAQTNLNTAEFVDLETIIPNLDEQKIIVDYLDAKCSKIDSIIAKQEQIIDKLKEYKLSLITETVTRGLNPNTEMKDSRIEWIGYIPTKWSVSKIGTLFDFIGGYAFNSEDYKQETDYQVVRIGNVKNDYLPLSSNPVYISEEKAEEASKVEVKPGYILFTMTGTKGKRDYFFTCLVSEEMLKGHRLFINQRVGGFVAHEGVCAGYYNYLFKESRILDSIFLYETGTANQGNLGIESIKRTRVQVPPLEEQKQIADYLDLKTIGINGEIEKRSQIIEKLQEYKKSLIYEVVTGKKEV